MVWFILRAQSEHMNNRADEVSNCVPLWHLSYRGFCSRRELLPLLSFHVLVLKTRNVTFICNKFMFTRQIVVI